MSGSSSNIANSELGVKAAQQRSGFLTHALNKTRLLTTLIALAALCDFLYMLPFVGDVSKQTGIVSLTISAILGLLLTTRFLTSGKMQGGSLVIAVWLLFVFVWLYGISPARFFVYVGLMAILMLTAEQQQSAFNKFILLFSTIILVNVIAYPLISLGLLPSLGEIDPAHWLKQEVGMHYENFGISFVFHGNFNSFQLGDLLLYRMSAWFEEPGNVGTIAALLLTATDFKMDWKGKVLLIGGILSLSMAFFAIVIAYSSIKKPKIFFYMLFMLIFVAWYFQDNEFVSSKLIDRVSISDQGITGDNRTEVAFDSAYNEYVSTPSVWMGHDSEHQLYKLHYNSSSWKNLVWDYGIVGTALYLSTFLFIFIHAVVKHAKGRLNRLKHLLPFVLVFVLSIYQRPYVLIISFFLIFVGAMVLRNTDEVFAHE